MTTREDAAVKIAEYLNNVLKSGDVQICNYACRYIVKRGCTMVVDGNGLRVNGKGAAFIVGSFKAYSH